MLKRNYIAMLLLLVAGLAGCSKSEEPVAPVPEAETELQLISFGTRSADDPTDGATASSASMGRAELVESGNSALFRSKPFAVYGEWIDTSSGDARTEVFRDQQVHYDATSTSSSGWTYDPLQAWQYSGEYDFRAYWPATATTMGTATARNLALEYSLLLHDEDLMVAYTHCPTGNGGNPVELQFRHTLAAVVVKFRTQETDRTYRVKRCFFTSLNYIGALGYYDTEQTVDLTTRWHFAEGARATVNESDILLSQRLREWSDATGRELTASADDYPEEFALFLPQSLSVESGTPPPSITFTVEVDWATTDTITTTVELPSTDAEGNEMVWRAGKKYIYLITVEADRLEIEVETCDWDEVDALTGDIYI